MELLRDPVSLLRIRPRQRVAVARLCSCDVTAALDQRTRRVFLLGVVAQVAIVVSGGAVRLTGSGLGCPTWPRCSEGSYIPHGPQGIHGLVEFGNRLFTFVLVAVVAAVIVAAWRLRPV